MCENLFSFFFIVREVVNLKARLYFRSLARYGCQNDPTDAKCFVILVYHPNQFRESTRKRVPGVHGNIHKLKSGWPLSKLAFSRRAF
jgi:hypothetical protein